MTFKDHTGSFSALLHSFGSGSSPKYTEGINGLQKAISCWDGDTSHSGSVLRERVLHHHRLGNKASSVLFIPHFTDRRPKAGDGHHAFDAPSESGKMIESIVLNTPPRPGRALMIGCWLIERLHLFVGVRRA